MANNPLRDDKLQIRVNGALKKIYENELRRDNLSMSDHLNKAIMSYVQQKKKEPAL